MEAEVETESISNCKFARLLSASERVVFCHDNKMLSEVVGDSTAVENLRSVIEEMKNDYPAKTVVFTAVFSGSFEELEKSRWIVDLEWSFSFNGLNGKAKNLLYAIDAFSRINGCRIRPIDCKANLYPLTTFQLICGTQPKWELVFSYKVLEKNNDK